MRTLLNRRAFLSVTGAIAASALSRAGWAQPAGALTRESLNGLTLLTGAGANVTLLTGPDGALLVDGGLPERSADVLSAAGHSATRPLRILFNTNWRAEHTGSNRAARAAGADVFAHENTKLWLGGDFFVEWENAHYAPQPPDALPNRTFYTAGSVDFGGERVEYGHLPRAHTDGDVYVFFPNRNVIAVGDLLSVGSYPIVDYSTGGWIGGLHDATQALVELTDAQTIVVPAAGPPGTRADLEAQLEMCAAVRQRCADAYRQGKSLKHFVASQPTLEFDERFGDPALFLALVYRGAWGHVRELGGII